MFDWSSAAVGLGGSAIGAAAAIASQVVTQSAIAKRERADRLLRGSRVRALCASYIQAAARVVAHAAAGNILETEQVATAMKPIVDLVNDPDLCLALDESQITAVSAVRATMDTCIRAANGGRPGYEWDKGRAKDRASFLAADTAYRKVLVKAYTIGFQSLNASLRHFGATPVPPDQGSLLWPEEAMKQKESGV